MAARKAHVKRIYAVTLGDPADPTSSNTVNPDVWIDVMRIDLLPTVLQGDPTAKMGQITNYRFKWDDDPNSWTNQGDVQQENANPKRRTHQLKIMNPDDDTQFINLWIVDRLTTGLFGTDSGIENQGTNFVFNNTPFFTNPDNPVNGQPSNRTTSVVRVINNDLGGSSNAPDMSQGASPVDWETVYLPALQNGTKDDSQHVIVEMADDFKILFGPNAGSPIPLVDAGIMGQVIRYTLPGNRPVENLFDRAGGNDDPKAPAVRLDPLQAIVNVKWGPGAVKLAYGIT